MLGWVVSNLKLIKKIDFLKNIEFINGKFVLE
jgi:hypothetical protein